jgi:hypothetical protein
VLFEINVAERGSLDEAEGLGVKGHYRDGAFVVLRRGTKVNVSATPYLADNPDFTLVLYDWYLALIVSGAREHRFDRRRIRRLLESEWQPHTGKAWGGRNGLLWVSEVDDDLPAFFKEQSELAKRRTRRS